MISAKLRLTSARQAIFEPIFKSLILETISVDIKLNRTNYKFK